jgi:hypothetical protein
MKPNIKKGLQAGLGCLIMPAILAAFIFFGNTKGCKNIMQPQDDLAPDRDMGPRINVNKTEKVHWGDSIYIMSQRIDSVYLNPRHRKKN